MLLLTLLALPSAPTVQTWRVVAVAAPDVLNVRARADANAPLVGKLLADATGVVELEQDGMGWMRVRLGEIEGWVNHRYLRPEFPAGGALPSELACVGFEPSWGATISAGQWRLTSPASDTSVLQPMVIAPQPGGSWVVTHEPGLSLGQDFLIVQARPDGGGGGESDDTFPYRAAAFVHADRALHGDFFDNGVCHVSSESDRARR